MQGILNHLVYLLYIVQECIFIFYYKQVYIYWQFPLAFQITIFISLIYIFATFTYTLLDKETNKKEAKKVEVTPVAAKERENVGTVDRKGSTKEEKKGTTVEVKKTDKETNGINFSDPADLIFANAVSQNIE